MTLSLAFLLVVILLIYDMMFLKMLRKRKQKILFSIYIEAGEIDSTEGDIPNHFLVATKELCRVYQPGKLKIMAVLKPKPEHNKFSELCFSGTLDDKLKTQLINLYHQE
ncbi:MAG: hypothetical protein QM479_02815 [Pseudomonadota bacterium]